MAKKDVFPRWMYHKDIGGKLFNTQEDLDEAGEGWFDSPDEVARQERQEPDVGADTSSGVVGARATPEENDGRTVPPYAPKPGETPTPGAHHDKKRK